MRANTDPGVTIEDLCHTGAFNIEEGSLGDYLEILGEP